MRPYLCGLTLLLKLLQLLGSEETHRLIASNELSTRWHGCEDDVATQAAETEEGKQKQGISTSLWLRMKSHTK